MIMRRIFFITTLILLYASSFANISLPAIFSDRMVLQQKSTVSVWGWGKPNETVRITVSWNPETEYSVKVLNQSKWSLDIVTPQAGGPYEMLIKGYNSIEIKDILIGEVWLGSGQSNMEWTPAMRIDNAEEEKSTANYPEIRFFTVLTSTALAPQQHLTGEWVICTPETMSQFSAIMYFFGRELHRKLEVPVGLINSSWGGTPIEVWMPEFSITGDRLLQENAALLKPVAWGPVEPGRAYNAMIHPLIPYCIKGALWYQGEANVDHPAVYARALSTLIESWRALWGYDFPFYYAQIAPWSGYGTDNVNGAIIRDQQRMVLKKTEKTGMAVLSDIGNLKNIHPGNKTDAGKRLAVWALHHDYGLRDMPVSGPLVKSYQIEGEKITIRFEYVYDGLVARDGELREFEILDGKGEWIPVKAEISGDRVVVKMDAGVSTKGIRFGYRNDSDPNLFNSAGLPASCFEIIF